MLTRDEVVCAYRLILGREPESEAAVDHHVRNTAGIAQLRRAFLDSDEFRSKLPKAPGVGRHYRSPAIDVQLDGPPEQLAAMFERIAGVWQGLGETEPHWSVLSSPQFTAANIAAAKKNFYASGFQDRDVVLAFFRRNGIAPDPSHTVLELGCGVGRISLALAASFAHVTGVDVSRAHLALAEEHRREAGVRNLDFRPLTAIEDVAALPEADLLVSLIVLQHNPPPVIRAILRGMLARVRPGGYAFFQVPTYAQGYRFDWSAYLAGGEKGIEMHVLPQRSVHGLLAELGFETIEVQEDNWTGLPAFASHTFFARRRRDAGRPARLPLPRWLRPLAGKAAGPR